MKNSARGGNGARNADDQALTTYGEFPSTHLPTFTEAAEPLEAHHWLCTIESKFRLLCCTEHHKSLFTTQQLLGNAGSWWVNYTTAHPVNYQLLWTKFYDAFHAPHIPAGIMKRELQEFMDKKQTGRSIHCYSKLFNHLAQYAPEG
jgi:hypothetical protein